jgi:hypothetical protein
MTEIALLGKMAARSARPLEFDASSPAITNDAEANSWINPPHRRGWELSERAGHCLLAPLRPSRHKDWQPKRLD